MKSIEHLEEIKRLLKNNLNEDHRIKFVQLTNPIVLKIMLANKNTYIEIDEKLLTVLDITDITSEFNRIKLYNVITGFQHPHVDSPKDSFVLSISHRNE